MTRIPHEAIALYDAFTHTHLDRRALIDGLTRLTGSTAAALALLPLLQANAAAAPLVPANDPRLATSTHSWQGVGGTGMSGYLARPKAGAAPAGVLVIHENRGLNDHIRDVARRTALAGYTALAPDFLSPVGGTPADEDAARQAIGKVDPQQATQQAVAALRHLATLEKRTTPVGAVGFCWGGGMVGRLAVAAGDVLDAAVVFYGPPPEPAAVPGIEAPLLLHYAGLDERINAAVPAFREALTRANVPHTVHMYEGANHAFHNDTSAARYDAEAARLAWDRTLAFFREHLKGA